MLVKNIISIAFKESPAFAALSKEILSGATQDPQTTDSHSTPLTH